MKEIETILLIKELSGEKINEGESYCYYDGYRVETNKRSLFVVISNGQDCCEHFGNITSNDNFEDFIGAEITEIRYIDNADYNDCEILKNTARDSVDVFDCAFIDINTNRGNLQFAVYNSHNGYYGHDIRAFEKQKELK